ncbi:MAG: hypothetical protein JNK64_27095 [Myxococcales bacterium]|nr:hypothetical protein [Myxococcales bacterium]
MRYALEEYGAAIAVEKGSVTMLAGAEGMAPVAAPLAQITVRRAFGAYTRQLEELQCARLGEVIDGPVPCAHKAPHDRIEQGDYVVPYGRSYAIGARVGALTLDEQVGAVATVEAVVEHACPGGAIFGSLVVDFIANLKTPVQRYHGGQGARLVLGGRVGHFKRVGLIGSIGGRRWVAGKEDEFDYSAEVMLFGAWDNIRIGAGIVRSLNAKAGVDAGTQDGQFVPTLWLSPQI